MAVKVDHKKRLEAERLVYATFDAVDKTGANTGTDTLYSKFYL